MKEVQIFTDGACSGNPGAGGYGAILRFGAHEKEISGGFAQTTNNIMYLLDAIESIKILKEPCKVTIYTDYQYLANGITKGWAKSWKARGWKKSNKEPALNPELWEELLRLCDIHTVEIVWIKGHAGHPENERCDQLAVAAATRAKEKSE